MSEGVGRGAGTQWSPTLLDGNWEMRIEWRTPFQLLRRSRGTVGAKARIFAGGDRFGMEVESPGSDSRTRIAEWIDSGVGSPELHYVYDVTPRADTRTAPHPYTGAAILRYDADRHELRGNYWTSQMGVGSFTLTRPKPDDPAAVVKEPIRTGSRRSWRPGIKWLGPAVVSALLFAVFYFLLVAHPWQAPSRPRPPSSGRSSSRSTRPPGHA